MTPVMLPHPLRAYSKVGQADAVEVTVLGIDGPECMAQVVTATGQITWMPVPDLTVVGPSQLPVAPDPDPDIPRPIDATLYDQVAAVRRIIGGHAYSDRGRDFVAAADAWLDGHRRGR